MRLRVVLTSTVTMTLALCGAASAAVTASEDASTITITGTAANDVTVLSDEGTDVRITNAVKGANCAQSGSDVLCPRGSRTITVSLQAGDDDITKLAGGGGTLDGGTGIDTVSYTGRTSGMTIDLAAGTAGSAGVVEHRVASFERANGSDGNDVITGTSGANTLQGGAGDDRLVPGPGSDSVRGGPGTDTLDYSASPVGIHANLEPVGGLRVHEFAATPTDDVLADTFEVLTGSPFADVLRGGNQVANSIRGGSGNDVLDGLGGDDTLSGESGNDRFGHVATSVQETATAGQVTVGNAGDGDGRDTLLGGTGNDDVNARDGQLDAQIDCGAGTDIGRQDLVDDEGNLDVDSCETLETTAVDQLMTVVAAVRKSRKGLQVRLACPRRSKVVCKGVAGRAKRAEGNARRGSRYRVRRGRAKTVVVRGAGKFLVLRERDQQRRPRVLSRRL